MTILSEILHFLTHHRILAIFAFALVGFVLSTIVSAWRRRGAWYLFVLFFVLGNINVFAGSWLNAAFLAAFGTEGSAIITHAEQTSSQLNDHDIWDYEAVVKTADGRDVVTDFDTMSASIYPIRNAILIPPEGERFVVKYIPGFERNIAIMSDLSDYGKRLLIAEDLQPVARAGARYGASPGNRTFREDYRDALQAFLNKHRDDADADLIDAYERKLKELGQTAD